MVEIVEWCGERTWMQITQVRSVVEAFLNMNFSRGCIVYSVVVVVEYSATSISVKHFDHWNPDGRKV